jgi:NAD(P)H-hydrate repair Nnr-like enzyme with NAD(P)H-hydrate dehydratase domain
MTPHHGELAELLDRSRAAITREPRAAARATAKAFGAIIVLKDHETIIADTDGSLLSSTAPTPGLGTAGSGDVLAGTIGGLLARGANPLLAAGWGVWLHGAAGLAAAGRSGALGFLASDMLRELPALVSANSA